MVKNKQQKSTKNKIINVLAGLLLIIGLLLIFSNPIKYWIIGQMSNKNAVSNVSAASIEKNNQTKVARLIDKVVDLI